MAPAREGRLTPLSPRTFFAEPWAGTGELTPRGLGRLLGRPRQLAFRSWTTPISESTWLVHDESVWQDGRVERRDGVATVLDAGRVRLTYDDMPGGTELALREDGWSFAPYRIAVPAPVLPIAILIGCRDECVIQPDGTLVDTIEMRFMGLAIARVTMRLRRATTP